MSKLWTQKLEKAIAKREANEREQERRRIETANRQLRHLLPLILGEDWEANFEGQPENGAWQDKAGYIWSTPVNSCSSFVWLSWPVPEGKKFQKFGRESQVIKANIHIDSFDDVITAWYQIREDFKLLTSAVETEPEESVYVDPDDERMSGNLYSISRRLERGKHLSSRQRAIVEFARFVYDLQEYDPGYDPDDDYA